jgi:hypothetical protein
LSPVELKQTIALLQEFTGGATKPLSVILLGGLALQFYGMSERATVVLDAEVDGDLEALFQFLKSRRVPSDLSENISGRSIVAMPPGYRERVVTIYQGSLLRIGVLSPPDLIIAKLRRSTEEDMEDALFVARQRNITPEEIERSAEAAICHSVKDTALFLFREHVRLFLKRMRAV